jgi:lipid-binding SYLF domain-containing protein
MNVNSQSVYLETVTAHQLPQGIGMVSLSHLALAFSQMAKELRSQDAPASQQEAFQSAIADAAGSARHLTTAERTAVQNTLFTAFDGLPRNQHAMAVRADFLRQVRFPLSAGVQMFRTAALSLCLVVAVASTSAANKEESRLENSGVVLEEVLGVPDNIPQELLDKAECVIVIPSMLKVAVGLGGNYGRGAMVCRTGASFAGPWGAPAMYALDGGSVGLQLGAQATDLVLLVMNRRGVEALLDSKVKLGGSASAAAGPKGRDVSAATDATMRAEILSYSRTRGLFAGISLDGASLRPDNDASEQVYGRRITARAIVNATTLSVPASGRRFVDALEKSAPLNDSKPATR